jgi:hypothetical protein
MEKALGHIPRGYNWGERTLRRYTYAVKFFSLLFQIQNKTYQLFSSPVLRCQFISTLSHFANNVVLGLSRSTLSSIS